VVDGFRVAPATGIVTGCYILPRDANGNVDDSADYQFVARENFIHLTRPMRFDQVRGIPDLAPVINTLVDYQSLNTATLSTAQKQAMAAFAIKRDGGIGGLGARGGGQDVGTVLHEKFEDGQVYYLKPGEAVEPLGTMQPGGAFFAYNQMLLRVIGAALGLPYEFVLLDFSQGNYSSSRAALLQTYRTFATWQAWLDRPMQRLWNWRIAKAIKDGQLDPAPKDEKGVSTWFRVQWSHPEFEWVDPDSQAIAETREIMAGKKSWSMIARKTGVDLEDIIVQKEQDIALAIDAAARIRAKYPDEQVHWTRLIDANVMGGQPPEIAAKTKQDELALRKQEVGNGI
jgi:lambda family phage portal protein